MPLQARALRVLVPLEARMSVVVNGVAEEIPGVETISFLDPGGPPHTKRVYKRDRAPTGIVMHMVIGEFDAHVVLDANGNPAVSTSDTSASNLCRRTAKILPRKANGKVPPMASEHLVISTTGRVFCIADLATESTWHASGCNPHTIGIEGMQIEHGGMFHLARKKRMVSKLGVYIATYTAYVLTMHWLCERLDIPKRIPMRNGSLIKGVVKKLNQDKLKSGKSGPAGKDWPGAWSHHHSTDGRGLYDPGLILPTMLLESGFEGVDPDVVT